MSMEWSRDVDAELGESKAGQRRLLVDFSAAPA
jgi:hypothetical protein